MDRAPAWVLCSLGLLEVLLSATMDGTAGAGRVKSWLLPGPTGPFLMPSKLLWFLAGCRHPFSSSSGLPKGPPAGSSHQEPQSGYNGPNLRQSLAWGAGLTHSQKAGHLVTKDKVHGRLQGAPPLTPCFSHHLPHPLLALDLSAQGAAIQLHLIQIPGPTPGTLSLPPRPQLYQAGLHFPNIQQTAGSLHHPPGLSCKITE